MAEDYMQLYQKALTGLQTGGKKLEAALAEIEEGKRQAIGRGQQALVSGGLGGTTVMGGVPLQAEKIAAGQRLGARGRAEETYLTTLASFAAFAQRGEEAQRQREFEAQQAGLGRQYAMRQTYQQQQYATGQAATAYERQQQQIQQQQQYAAEQTGMQREWETGQTQLKYEQQFPSIYDQTGGQVPSQPEFAGAAPTAPTTGISGGGGYEIDYGIYGDDYTPQTGEYMSVAGGAGGPILGGGATTSYGGGTGQLQPGQTRGYYGKATYGPTSYAESMAYSRWKKQNPGGSTQQWAMQYR
jgi:hypothetical protein